MQFQTPRYLLILGIMVLLLPATLKAQQADYDLVITGARVIDPETMHRYQRQRDRHRHA